jgi:hypothetical protein
VLGERAQIQLHLSFELRAELADLELDDDEPLELSVAEQQIDIETIIIDLGALPARDEGEARA